MQCIVFEISVFNVEFPEKACLFYLYLWETAGCANNRLKFQALAAFNVLHLARRKSGGMLPVTFNGLHLQQSIR
jgi:hypothetical protein